MKIIIAFTFVLVTAKCYGQQIAYKDLIGVWDLYEDPRGIPLKIVFDFKDSLHLVLSDVVGVDSFTYTLEKFTTSYRLHLAKKGITNKIEDSYNLIKWIDDGILKIQPTFDKTQGIKSEDDLSFKRAKLLIKRK